MKKLISSAIIIIVATLANASLKYECSRYVNSSYKGWTTVVANNKKEAEKKALCQAQSKNVPKRSLNMYHFVTLI